ncbi:hypothetical protein [Flavobacterium sharifuzzamanii]|uniref:hypothetical protein n=1 Tax=Flavobacterium sharifuzzamanii TaxID=2211133 RepID=UPI000DAD3159|nr:hypothetical protein [Flavobacterium sharifuzzamanii]KAF2080666.1 hypothetical protein DMA14_10825 [Flavobacterium sharifuzzamanii]
MDKITFTRSELYDLVWKFPIPQIAKHYEISSMGIKNACEKMEIPLPKSRFWVGPEYKRKNIPELSLNFNGNNEITILKKTYEMQLRVPLKSTPLLDLTQSIKNDVRAPLSVSDTLEKPVEIIASTKQYWESKIVDQDILLDKLEILDLYVSKENLDRALRFMNAFIRLIQYRGHEFRKGLDGLDTVVFKNGIEIKVDLREAQKRLTKNSMRETWGYVFTGDFIFRISRRANKKEWRDGKIKLENNLALIMAKLELMAAED